MRIRHTLGLLLVLLIAAASHGEDVTTDSATTFIKIWADSFIDLEPEKMMALYDDSKEVDVISSAGLRYRGSNALQEAYEEAQREVRFVESTAEKIDCRVLGDTAVLTFEHVYKTKLLTDMSQWKGRVRTTSVLHRRKDKWKIVLEHSSSIRGVKRVTRIEE